VIYLALVCVAQCAVLALLLVLTFRERGMLLQRIQAPEAAAIQHQMAELPSAPPHLPFDDDAAFHATREEMAEMLRRG
jgi:hypothetical protein